jgi:hypothetical protein
MVQHMTSKQTPNKQIAMTTPQTRPQATPGENFAVFGRLVFPAHALCGGSTEVEKNILG